MCGCSTIRAVPTKVGALGEHFRFRGVLPDAVRELVILRYSARQREGYEWSHHQRPAKLSGLDQATIDALTAGEIPETLPDASQAALAAVDAVAAKRSIPAEVQQRFVAAHGNAGIVELVRITPDSTASWATCASPSISRLKKASRRLRSDAMHLKVSSNGRFGSSSSHVPPPKTAPARNRTFADVHEPLARYEEPA